MHFFLKWKCQPSNFSRGVHIETGKINAEQEYWEVIVVTYILRKPHCLFMFGELSEKLDILADNYNELDSFGKYILCHLKNLSEYLANMVANI